MLMQYFDVTNKEHYGLLWYFWSGQLTPEKRAQKFHTDDAFLRRQFSLRLLVASRYVVCCLRPE